MGQVGVGPSVKDDDVEDAENKPRRVHQHLLQMTLQQLLPQPLTGVGHRRIDTQLFGHIGVQLHVGRVGSRGRRG